MFQRNSESKNQSSDTPEKETPATDTAGDTKADAEPAATPSPNQGASMASSKPQGFVPELPRRTVDFGGPNTARPGIARNTPDSKRLTVGPEISLSGEITACDTLVVEGRVEATLENSRLLEVTNTGSFKGKVSIEDARIAGHFEGSLIVRGKLSVEGTGQIIGDVKYGTLEVEAGGVISGNAQVFDENSEGA